MADVQLENGYIKIANDFYDALARIRIPGEARQVYDFIIRKTWGYNKKCDAITLTQFALGTGIIKPHIIRAIQLLQGMCLIVVTKKGNVTNNGNEESRIYQIIKDFEKWQALPKKVTLPKKVISITKKGNAYIRNTKDNKDNILHPPVPVAPPSPHQDFVKYFTDKFYGKLQRKYFFNGGKDGEHVKELLKAHDIGYLKRLCDSFFTSDDPFIKSAGYTIGVFYSQVNKLISTTRRIDPAVEKIMKQFGGGYGKC